MRIFATLDFNRWLKKNALTDTDLIDAVKEMESGLFDASLGGSVYKKRIASGGKGKSGSFRTIVAFKQGDKTFFVDGFEKSEKDNISPTLKKYLKHYAKLLFGYNEKELKEAIKSEELREVK